MPRTRSHSQEQIVCGNKDYQIKFHFDEEWDGHPVKTARFVWNGTHEDKVFEGDVCDCPAMFKTNLCAVGVFAGDLSTTTPGLISCRKSILCEDGPPAPPSEDVYHQIMELINNLPSGGGGSTGGTGGQDGKDGKSAYEIAVDNGFLGLPTFQIIKRK